MTTFNNTKTAKKRQQLYLANYSLPEVIEATTPLFLATVGGVIAVVVLIQPNVKAETATAGLGLAGTAIAGAAGLARTGRNQQDFSVKQQDGNLEVDTPADR